MPKKNHQTSRRLYQRQARKLTQSEYLKWLGLYSEFFLLLRSFNDQSITRPTLVIMGSEDYLFLPSAKDFVSNHKTVSLITIEGAGHICNIEKPTEVNQKILNFLNNQPSQAKKQLTKVPI